MKTSSIKTLRRQGLPAIANRPTPFSCYRGVVPRTHVAASLFLVLLGACDEQGPGTFSEVQVLMSDTPRDTSNGLGVHPTAVQIR